MSINDKKITFDGTEYKYTQLTIQELAEYQELKDMYYGEGGFKNGNYLEKFPRESDGSVDKNGNATPDFFGVRKKIAHYENIFAPNLDAKVDAIFAKEQERTIKNDVVMKYVDNPTMRRGETMSEYQRNKLLNAKLFGAIFEVIDAPIQTVSTGVNDGSKDKMPYSYIVTPMQTVGYNIDNGGALDMLAYYEDIDQRNGDITDSDNDIMRVWLKTVDGRYVTFQSDNDAVILESVRYLDTFPIDLVEDNSRYDSSKIAKSKYIGELSTVKSIYNLTSWFNDSFFKNCFAFLAINGKLPTDLDLSNSSVLMYTGEGVNAPEYIAPPVEHLKTMIEDVERMVQNVNSNMNSVIYISVIASGEARKEADKTRIQQQKQDAQNLQDNEYWMVNVALRNYLDFAQEYTVIYAKNFESLTKSDELDPLVKLLDMDLKDVVANQIKADAIRIIYSSDKERGEDLAMLQIETVETTDNDAFDAPTIEE